MNAAEFARWTALSSEVFLLVAPDGEILAANNAGQALELTSAEIIGSNLTKIAASPAETVLDTLRLASRSRRPLPSALRLRSNGSELDFRCDAMLADRPSEHARTSLLVKLTPKERALRPYRLVNQKINELNRELHRRRVLERELEARNEYLRLRTEALERSEARFAQLADAIPQLAWMAQPDGEITWYNTRWYDYTGTTFEQMRGWGWQDVHDPDVLPAVIEQWKSALETGEPFSMVFPLRRFDGAYRTFLTRAMPFSGPDDVLECWFGTCTDISEQKELEEELRRTAARLSEADRRKDEFLATLAHEIRNPLSPISSGLELMKTLAKGAGQLEQVCVMMERQTQQLVALVDDLLDVSRITRGILQLRKSRCSLREIVDTALESSESAIDRKNHRLNVRIPDGVEIEVDPHRLAQVLSNLLNNAAKFTPAGGRIELSAERSGGELLVTVRDSGIGIAPELQERVFDMFRQVDQGKDYSSGMGIGLALVKAIVELHGGSVAAQSAGPGTGTTVRLRLPVVADGEEPIEDDGGAVPHPKMVRPRERHRVLVVDDNTDAAHLLGLMIEALGHEVRLAADGEQALAAGADFHPHLVLMDLGMPRMNGYEAARHMRRKAWGRTVFLVALTGWGQEQDRMRTSEAGFDQHLVKPAKPEALRQLLDKLHQDRTP